MISSGPKTKKSLCSHESQHWNKYMHTVTCGDERMQIVANVSYQQLFPFKIESLPYIMN